MKMKIKWKAVTGVLIVLTIATTLFMVSIALAENQGGENIVNINTADTAELTKLPGIGESKAAAIVKYRSEHGPFKNVEELIKIRGISTGILEKISGRIATE